MDPLLRQPSAQEGPETPGVPSREPEAPADAATGPEAPAPERKAPTPAREPEAPAQEPKAPSPAQQPDAPAREPEAQTPAPELESPVDDDDDAYPPRTSPSAPLAASSGAAQEPPAPAGGWRRQRRVVAKKFAVFVNPRLLQLNKPFTLAFVIVLFSTVSFGVYFGYLLNQCSRQSFTTTTRSELQEWFDERDSLDPMNGWNANWNCIYYTAKLMASDGDLFPEMADTWQFSNDYFDNCAATGLCEQRYVYRPTPGNVRYNKCDVGTVRYTRESRSQFYQWLRGIDAGVFHSDDGHQAEQELASTMRSMLSSGDGAGPVNPHAITSVWVAAHDVHLVPGALDEISENLQRINDDAGEDADASSRVSRDHPVWLYLQSRPYKKFDGSTVESENMHRFEELGGMRVQLSEAQVDVLLRSQSIRLRSRGGGEFPGICGDIYDYGNWNDRQVQSRVHYGTDRRRSAVGRPGRPDCMNGPDWQGNLSQTVLGFEFWLQRKEAVETAFDDRRILNMHPARAQYIKDSRLLSRDMFCDPADYDEFILYQAQPGEHGCTADKLEEPECTLVRKCDLTGMTSATAPGVTDTWAHGEPALQPEYGSFLVVYRACPKLIGTAGVALGFIGQIELLITFLTMGCCLGCGCVRVRGDVETGGCVQRAMRRVEVAVGTATEAQEQNPGTPPATPTATA